MSTRGPVPPVAEQRPFEVPSPHGTRLDEYFWLRDDQRSDADVLAHLRAEDDYKNAMLAHLAPLEERLYGEIVGRIKQDDSTVPFRERGYWYYRRFEAGKEYPLHARRRDEPGAPEEVMLDLVELASGHDFYDVAEFEVSPDNRLLAYAEDTVGRRQYSLRFKDLVNGTTLPDVVPNVEPAVVWNADGSSVLYVEKDPDTLLGTRVRRHVLGTDPSADPVVYEEADDSFYLDVGRSKDGRYLYIYSQSTVSTEQRCADAADPDLEFRVLIERERDHEYHAEHFDGRWIIRTNWQAPDFRLVQVPFGNEADGRGGTTSSRPTPVRSSIASTFFAISLRSRSDPAACARSGCGRGTAVSNSVLRRMSRRTA